MKKTLVVPAASIETWQSLAGEELYAHLLYTQLAANMQAAGLFGAQKHFEAEADDELSHYKKVRDIVNDFGGIIYPTSSYQITEKADNIGDALRAALDAERALMGKYDLAKDSFEQADDEASYEAVLQFIKIQRKSVGDVMDLMARYDILGGDGAGILIFDQELGK